MIACGKQELGGYWLQILASAARVRNPLCTPGGRSRCCRHRSRPRPPCGYSNLLIYDGFCFVWPLF